MDPFLEARWPGVHVSLIAYIQEALQPMLPADLRARAEERVLLETQVDIHSEPVKDRRVIIVDVRAGNRVVTAIEVLSPWNKGAGRLNETYRAKVGEYARGGVNLVEIDLLRSSRARLEVGQRDLPSDRRAPYLTCIRRSSRPSRWEVYPMPLRDRLPPVPVPLREGEPDVPLDLQALIVRAYAAGGHDDIDYRDPPEPPLDPEDEVWANALLADAGVR
jgi:hypothetical protein